MDPNVSFDQVYEQYYGHVYHFLRNKVPDSVEAEDLAQEVFSKVFQHLPTLKDERKLRPWVFRIAANMAADYFRHPDFRRQAETIGYQEIGEIAEAIQWGEREGAGWLPEDLIEGKELSTCVHDLLGSLSPENREVLRLHDVMGFTNGEIAERLQTTPGSVKVRLHRARKKVKGVVDQQCRCWYEDGDLMWERRLH